MKARAPKRLPVVRDTRQRVLAAALEEFGWRGYANSSIEEIAARAGLTKGAVYYYFHDKDDLAVQLQQELWQRLGEAARAAFDPSTSANANLKAGFRSFLASLDDLGQARFFLRDCWAVPTFEAAGRTTHDAGVELVRALLEGGDMSSADADAAARVLLGAYAEATLHVLTTGETGATVRVVERMIDAFV